ncbi:MAG: sigma-54-dependent transcriptional regulator [Spirochaetota bacterium]
MNILIIDDEAGLRRGLAKRLLIEGYTVYEAADYREKMQVHREQKIHIALLDLRLAGEDGHQLLRSIKRTEPDTSIIIITGYGTIQSAVECIKSGASNYLSKPIDQDMLLTALNREIQTINLQSQNAGLRQSLDDMVERDKLVTSSKRLPSHIDDIILKVKDLNVNTLISGETGTGKEVTAKRIHFSGLYRDRPFISINCSALNDNLIESELFGHEKGAFTGAAVRKLGRFEIAADGTLFLDEIGDMSLTMQSKLLRVLEERTFESVGGTQKIKTNCRIIAASNKNLKREVEEQRFRSDLYYRLNVVQIHLPPLRERTEEIPYLVDYFIEEANHQYNKSIKTISSALLQKIMNYSWPGNIRQLKNVITNAVLLSDGDTFNALNIPDFERNCDENEAPNSFVDLKTYVNQHTEQVERELLSRVLQEEERNISTAALRLGISRKTLYKKIESYGL